MSKPPNNKTPNQPIYSAVQLNFTPEIEVFDMLSERSPSIFSMTYLTQHMEYLFFLR